MKLRYESCCASCSAAAISASKSAGQRRRQDIGVEKGGDRSSGAKIAGAMM